MIDNNFAKYLCLFYSGLLLWGCATDKHVQANRQVIHYRAPVDPLGKVTAMAESPSTNSEYTYYQAFLAWEIEHDNLVRSVGKSFLGVVEAHRLTIRRLRGMSIYLNQRQNHILDNYIKLYENLLADVKANIPTRIIRRRYRHLYQEVHRRFSP